MKKKTRKISVPQDAAVLILSSDNVNIDLPNEEDLSPQTLQTIGIYTLIEAKSEILLNMITDTIIIAVIPLTYVNRYYNMLLWSGKLYPEPSKPFGGFRG